MKKILMAILCLATVSISLHAQRPPISIPGLTNSTIKVSENVAIAPTAPAIVTVLKNATLESSKEIRFDSPTITLEDFTIAKCSKIIIGKSVTTINIIGSVKLNCIDFFFEKAEAEGEQLAIQNTSNGDLTITVKNAPTYNNRLLIIMDGNNFKMDFFKK